jgi:polycystin 2
MFLAIINDTYSEVKNDMSTQKSEFELRDYFKKSYEKMLDRLNVKRDVSNYILLVKLLFFSSIAYY